MYSWVKFFLFIYLLKDALSLSISLSLSGRVTGEQLSSYAQLFRDSWSALENHRGLLQLALGTAQTLRHPTLAQWDACLAFERLLLQVSRSVTPKKKKVLLRMFLHDYSYNLVNCMICIIV